MQHVFHQGLPCLLFVTGGFINNNADITSSSEVIDLCRNDNRQSSCQIPADFPEEHYDANGLRTIDRTPLICGGSSLYRECYEYVPESQTWIQGPNTTGYRNTASSVEWPNERFLILSGSTADLFTTDVYDQRQNSFYVGPPLNEEYVPTLK